MRRFLHFTALCLCISAQHTFYDTSTLVYTQVIFRHGDRTPDSHCSPLFANPNITYFPVGFGGLTPIGKNKEFALGHALRKRYGKFLGNTYFTDLIEAISTDMPRTKMSLQLVLASLFPPSNEDRWNWDLNWQPIPYNYVSLATDPYIGYRNYYCSKYMKEVRANLNTTEVKTFLKQPYIKEVTDYLSNMTNFNIYGTTPIENAYGIYACLYAMEQTYQPLPSWSTPIYPDKVRRVAAVQYLLQTWNDNLVQYAGGPLVQKILTTADSKIAGKIPSTKISLYSAHEFNVAQILRAFNVFEPPFFPNYGSYVLIELHNILGEYVFKFFVQNYETANPKQLTVPGCSPFCPLLKLRSLMANRVPPANQTC